MTLSPRLCRKHQLAMYQKAVTMFYIRTHSETDNDGNPKSNLAK